MRWDTGIINVMTGGVHSELAFSYVELFFLKQEVMG